MALKFYNTLKRKKKVFKPIKKNFVGIYSCGPTVYNFPHIGNYRAYAFSDLLTRYLKYKGFSVKKVVNITDVDDKTIIGSQKQGVSLREFTKKYEKAFYEDLEMLKILPADVFCRATEHINEMVEMIKKLMKKSIAYRAEDGIYYKVSKFRNYGKLARIKIKELKAGASGRVKADEYAKEKVQDFALWKAWDAGDGTVFWETELGKGRPGWHIECSAMSTKYLGSQFDIHTGGVDLIFPHHQNEIAQSQGAGQKFVNYWLHNEWLLVDGQKMSKRSGNFYTLRDVLAKGNDPMSIRYLLLSTHYRQKLNFTFEGLDAAKSSLQRLKDFLLRLREVKGGKNNPAVDSFLKKSKEGFENALDDDLEISKALAAIFELVNEINKLIADKKISEADCKKVYSLIMQFNEVLGVIEEKEETLPKEVQKLIEEREKARAIRNWARADELRNALREKGIIIEDTPQGVRWKRA